MTNAEIEKLVAQNSVLIGDVEVTKRLEQAAGGTYTFSKNIQTNK